MNAAQFVRLDAAVADGFPDGPYFCLADNGCRVPATVILFRPGVPTDFQHWNGHACCDDEQHGAEALAEVLA